MAIVKPLTPAPQPNGELDTRNAANIRYTGAHAFYSIQGALPHNLETLQVSLFIIHRETGLKYRSRFNLLEDDQIERVALKSGERLGLRADLLAIDLSELSDLLHEYRKSHLLRTSLGKRIGGHVIISEGDKKACIDFLKAPRLMKRLNEMIGLSGVIGEEQSRLLLFVIAASYKSKMPLHALVQGSSGSGKTHLLQRISKLMPDEVCVRLTRITESSLYNYGEHELSNKILVIEDMDGLEENALYALRELQSNGALSSSTAGRDYSMSSKSGVKWVYGPICSLSATTQGSLYEDNMSRCFLVAVDEGSEQTERVLSYQDDLASGLVDLDNQTQQVRFLQNCIRLLKPIEVVNPYAKELSLPKKADKLRRLNSLFHHFVAEVARLHQYQRRRDVHARIVCSKEDIRQALEIIFEGIVLKVDELDGSLRNFYEKLKSYIARQTGGVSMESYEFRHREIREALEMRKTQLWGFMETLEELEYIRRVGGSSNRGYRYRVEYWDDNVKMRKELKSYLSGQLDALSEKKK